MDLGEKTAARIISLTKTPSHITLVLINLHWLPVKQRIEYKLLIFVFISPYASALSYLFELHHDYKPGRTGLRSANLPLLHEPRSNNSFGDRLFVIFAHKLWYHLPFSH